jgi:hypothetical protein
VPRRRSGTITLALASLAIAGAAATAVAAPPKPGHWKLVSGVAATEPAVSDAPGLSRTADGTLHLAWERDSGALVYTSFSPAGDMLAPPTEIVQGWTDVGDPAFVSAPGVLEIIFGGQESTAPGASIGLWTTVQNPDGSWVRSPSAFTKTYGVVSAVGLASNPVLAYESQSSVAVKAGLGEGDPETLKSGYTDGSPNIATDGTRVIVAWCAFASGAGGVYVQDVAPDTGKGVGGPQAVPGSLTTYHGTPYSTCVLQTEVSRRIPLVSAGGSFYTAFTTGYPTLTGVRVARVGGGSLTAVHRSGVSHIEPQLAADGNGRVWVGWIEKRSRGNRLVVRRSNPSVTVLGASVRIAAPKHFDLGSFEASATTDHLDVIGHATRAGANSLQHTIALPGLTLIRERVRKLSNGRRAITFRVLDAGDPVAGAQVKAQGKTATTTASGRAKLVVTGSPSARAKKAGYTSARG